MKKNVRRKTSALIAGIAFPLLLFLAAAAVTMIYSYHNAGSKYHKINYDYSKAKTLTTASAAALQKKIISSFKHEEAELFYYKNSNYDLDNFSFAGLYDYLKAGCRVKQKLMNYGRYIWVDNSTLLVRSSTDNLSMVKNCKFTAVELFTPNVKDYSFLLYNDLREAEVNILINDLRDLAIFNYLEAKNKTFHIYGHCLSDPAVLKTVDFDGINIRYAPENILSCLPDNMTTIDIYVNYGGNLKLQELSRFKKLKKLKLGYVNSTAQNIDLSGCKELEELVFFLISDSGTVTLPEKLKRLDMQYTYLKISNKRLKVKDVVVSPANFDFSTQIQADQISIQCYEDDELEQLLNYSKPIRCRKLDIEISDIHKNADLAPLRKLKINKLDISNWFGYKFSVKNLLSSGAKTIYFNNKKIK